MLRCLFVGALLCLSPLIGKTQENTDKQPLKITRSISLTPGYMERTFNSNESMKILPLELMQASSKGLDAAISLVEPVWAKMLLGWGLMYPNWVLGRISNTVYHEFGHARAMSAGGQDYFYNASADSRPQKDFETDAAYGMYLTKLTYPASIPWAGPWTEENAFTQPKAFPSFSKLPAALVSRLLPKSVINSITNRLNAWWTDPENIAEKDRLTALEQSIIRFMPVEKRFEESTNKIGDIYTTEEKVLAVKQLLLEGQAVDGADAQNVQILLEDAIDLHMTMAGLNNEMRFSSEISELTHRQGGHQAYFPSYFMGRFSTYSYVMWLEEQEEEGKVQPGNDVHNILRAYQNLGYNIDRSDLKTGSLLSLLLSSTTWSFVYSGFAELPKGSFVVHAPVWKGWRLPDLNFFLTTQGLSYQIVTGYQWNSTWYTGLTTEFVYKGNTAWEVGPSIGYTFTPQGMGQFDLSAQLIVSNEGEFGGNAKAKWTASAKNWRVGLHYIYHNAMTLVGERNIPFLSSGLMSGGEPSATNHEINITVSYLY